MSSAAKRLHGCEGRNDHMSIGTWRVPGLEMAREKHRSAACLVTVIY